MQATTQASLKNASHLFLPSLRRQTFLLWAFLLFVKPALAQITVAVAANVQYAMEKMTSDFQEKTGGTVKAVYASSGKLTTQIRNGAPFDVFVSADMNYPDSLFKWKKTIAAPRIYAYGKMVLWTTRGLDLSQGLAVLESKAARKIALADPDRAPYGREAMKALKRSGIYPRVRGKLVFGESISQVSQYVFSGNVDAGFNAKSVVLAPESKEKGTEKGKERGRGNWVEVDSTLYDPIAQGAAITKYGSEKNPQWSERFFEYLYSESARAILHEFGYVTPE